jgi:hypothetical protein
MVSIAWWLLQLLSARKTRPPLAMFCVHMSESSDVLMREDHACAATHARPSCRCAQCCFLHACNRESRLAVCRNSSIAAAMAIEQALPDFSAAASALLHLQIESKVPPANGMLMPVRWTCEWACSETLFGAAARPRLRLRTGQALHNVQMPLRQLEVHARARCLSAARILGALRLSCNVTATPSPGAQLVAETP